jgi:hypothetical protein
MSRTCLILLALLACTVSETAQAKDEPTSDEAAVDEADDDIAREDVPKWEPRSVKPFATQNLRLQGGVGWTTLKNPTDDILVEGIGVNGHIHGGDTFLDLFSYDVPVRAPVMFIDQTSVGDTVVSSFNERQGLFLESASASRRGRGRTPSRCRWRAS